MLFNSLQFVVFFLVVFFVYWFALKNNFRAQNIFLLLGSCIFYMAFIPAYILILAITILIDYSAGIYIEKTEGRKRKLILIISIISTCMVLFVFKYFNFFNSNFQLIADLLHLHYPVQMMKIILPIGLSFHTFQSLSYVVEVYRKNQKAEYNFLTYSLYVMFFPQLVAGPIERAAHLLPQFNNPRKFDYSLASSGAKLILLGYFKKVVIADKIAPFVNGVYNTPQDYPGFPMVVATVLFAFQIYCDFSGYSEIAIGTARLLGFELMTNFRQPYFSKSLGEFWHRWHISLSTWFRDYVYIPLGGNKVSVARNALNIFITFTVSGLWHGANWTFIVWGAFHGGVIVLERFTSSTVKKIFSFIPQAISNAVAVLFTFALACFGWIFFRANNMHDALFIIRNMFSDIGDYTNPLKLSIKFRGLGFKAPDLAELIFFIVFLIAVELFSQRERMEKLFLRKPILKWGFYYLILLMIVFLGFENAADNFIYFQF